ncbi:MAG TPA: DUF2914 domain-containing protein [Rhizomicrobium sp.]
MSPLNKQHHARDFIGAWRQPLTRYERHISAAAMVAGFVIDNYTFGRIDRPAANIIFIAYLALAAVSIALLHFLQSRADRKMEVAAADEETGATRDAPPPGSAFGRRLHAVLSAATQFALGGLLSGFLVFYSRSAVFAASWPFMVLLAAAFIGNEVFRRYRARLVFAGLVFFFALYSYAIFVVPVLLGAIGSLTFAVSGLLAIILFVLFLRVLRSLGLERFRQSRWRLFGGALAILALMNAFYFTDILPPLPLALANVGVYHSVKRTGSLYTAAAETGAPATLFNLSRPVLHVAPGEAIAVYSAVFAPIKLSTRIAHRWQWFDPKRKRWVVQSVVSYAISGGREGGYRGYTVKTIPRAGSWRVDIDTIDGRLIGRIAFEVAPVAKAPAIALKALR